METKIPEGLKDYIGNLYRGQYVFYLDGLSKPKDKPFDVWMEGDYLLLKSLRSITDSEAIEVSKMFTKYTGRILVDKRIKGGIILNKSYVCEKILFRYKDVQLYQLGFEWTIPSYTHRNIIVYQYLQQQGFALPVFYKGKLYSVAELEAMGIFKLQA